MADSTQSSADTQTMGRICHELGRPLSVIHAYADLLNDGVSGPLNPMQRDQMGTVLAAANEMALLVQSLYGLTELDAGELRLKSSAHDLGRLCSRLVEEYRPRFAKAELGLELLAAPGQKLVAEVDERRLVLSLSALLENGLRYTPAGGHVTMELRAQGERLEITVRDTGLGMAAEDYERVFERYCRLEDERLAASAKGAGIGLTLARATVEAHGGSLRARAWEGGSCFCVSLPCSQDSAGASAEGAASRTPGPGGPGLDERN